jgi:hypothetical protein
MASHGNFLMQKKPAQPRDRDGEDTITFKAEYSKINLSNFNRFRSKGTS